jgi:hypothetical protein
MSTKRSAAGRATRCESARSGASATHAHAHTTPDAPKVDLERVPQQEEEKQHGEPNAGIHARADKEGLGRRRVHLLQH